jgi:phosphohistidine phosphatase
MTWSHTLVLLRHAEAADSSVGRRDQDRPLTERGLGQATDAGAALSGRGLDPDLVLCSPAVRTRQTSDRLGLESEIDFAEEIYNAGSETLLELARLLDESVRVAMIIGHAPGLPALATQLTGPDSDQQAADVLASRYPTATLAEFTIDGPWADLHTARLDWIRLGS